MHQEIAPAKINLALHVRRRRADGYHDIESLFAFADGGDVVRAFPDTGISLSITGPFSGGLSAGPDNLVIRAAHSLQQIFQVQSGVRLELEKNLPVAAGLGGGSADAAAALRLLCRFWNLNDADLRIAHIAAHLGADVPACYYGKTVRGDGRGDELLPIEAGHLTGMPLLLVNPRIALATGPVFAGWDGVDRGALPQGEPLDVAIKGRNDLELPAIRIVPEIAALIKALNTQPGVKLARMSGSGASCFALFDTVGSLQNAARAVGNIWPQYWYFETALV